MHMGKCYIKLFCCDLPAPLSWTKTFSDIVILDDLDAVRNEL